jgi:hypothetical protein
MSSEFGLELTKLGLGGMDASTLAAQALKRNRRRIRMLAGLTIGLWILDFLMVPGFWMPFAAKMKMDATSVSQAADVPTLAKMTQDIALHIALVSGFILAVMTLASLLAAISTVWLVLTVRRVTLEQVSMGLAQISEQLRRLENSRQ